MQVVATVLSLDPAIDPDIPRPARRLRGRLAVGHSLPWSDRRGRVGYKDGQYLLNPTGTEMEGSQLDLVVAGTEGAVMMVESEAKGLSEETMLAAVVFGHTQMHDRHPCDPRTGVRGRQAALDLDRAAENPELSAALATQAETALTKAFAITEKLQRRDRVAEVKAAAVAALSGGETPKFTADQVGDEFFKLESNIVRQRILNGEPRIDGRDVSTVRPITVKTSVLPRTPRVGAVHPRRNAGAGGRDPGHRRDAQIIDALAGERREPFMMHYNFPPFSVGETGMMGSPKRREIGHGNLHAAVLPP